MITLIDPELGEVELIEDGKAPNKEKNDELDDKIKKSPDSNDDVLSDE